jgi:hypothetical protein
MGMQTDVLMTQPLGATAGNTFKMQNGTVLGPCRIKAIYGTSATAAGTVVLYDGTSTAGKPLGTISTPTAVNGGTYYILMPGEGIRVNTGVYAVITNVDSALLIYG